MREPNVASLQDELAASRLECVSAVGAAVKLTSEVARLTLALATSRQATSARTDFLAMIAHDLRSPLSVVSLSANALLKMVSTLNAGRPARKMIERIQHSTDLLSHFVSDLLDVTSVESGHLALFRKIHTIVGLIEETRDTLSGSV